MCKLVDSYTHDIQCHDLDKEEERENCGSIETLKDHSQTPKKGCTQMLQHLDGCELFA